MSKTEVATTENFVVPAFLKAEVDTITKSLMGGGSQKNLSIKGSRFRMMVGGEQVGVRPDAFLNVVIVNASEKVGRTFFNKKYVEGENLTPVCWTADGIRPNPKSEIPQNALCAGCPQDVSGSGDQGTKACKFSRKLAIVFADDINGDVYSMTLPAKSIFGKAEGTDMPLMAYANFLGARGCPITGVVTQMYFDLNAAVPKLFFKAARPLTEDEYRTCQEKGKSIEAKNAVTYDFKVKEKTNEEEFSTPAEPAPNVVKKKAAAPPAESKTLGDIVSEWAD